MPSSWLNGIFGTAGDANTMVQQQQASQAQQQTLQQGMIGSQQQASNQPSYRSSMSDLLFSGNPWQGTPYHVPIEYDTSNVTSRKMIAVIRKASEGLKAVMKVKESV